MIGIYFIATSTYKVYIPEFLDSLEKFRADRKKRVILLVDEIQEVSQKHLEYLEIEQHIVSDAPWPIVTLLKMWYIYKYRGNYSEIYYFNANIQIYKDIPQCDGRLIVTYHTHSNREVDGHDFLNPDDDNPKSLAYIGLHNYFYVQAAFFGGNADIVYRMCKDVSEWVESDLKRGVIPKWHDESYLNKWKTLHEDLCEVADIWGKYVFLYEHEDLLPK